MASLSCSPFRHRIYYSPTVIIASSTAEFTDVGVAYQFVELIKLTRGIDSLMKTVLGKLVSTTPEDGKR